MKLDSSRSFQSAAELPDFDDNYGWIGAGEEMDSEPPELTPIQWSYDLSSIPYNKEVAVAWNFTNTTHTKSIVTRYESDPLRLYLDHTSTQFILISDAKCWIDFPELPE